MTNESKVAWFLRFGGPNQHLGRLETMVLHMTATQAIKIQPLFTSNLNSRDNKVIDRLFEIQL